MRNQAIFLFCGFTLLVHSVCGSAGESLEIKIANIASCQGKIMLAVYDSENRFMNIDQAVAKEAIDLDVAGCTSTILYRASIPHGQHAIVVYHDANNNGVLDKNWLGAPVEAWGVSNNVRPAFREPTFRECAFIHSDSFRSITIDIQ